MVVVVVGGGERMNGSGMVMIFECWKVGEEVYGGMYR